MKITQKSLYLILSICFSWAINGQYIQVNDTYTAQQLIQNVLVSNSPCANVSNFSVSGDAFSGFQNSYGYFSAGTSNFPFSNGIVLSTGKATSAVGPNNFILSQGGTSWLGDSDLETALGITNSINATSLEFDFIPITNKISFDYIFSSEQYLLNASSNQCNYTDGFAFLLKPVDNSTPYQNLAIVPGTTIPVKINTVRGAGSVCPPANQSFFDAFNGTNHPTNFNGQTVIMKAEANVIPGTPYHIKLVIADQGNNLYDSAIFLGANSFNVGPNLGSDKLIATNNPICEGDIYDLNATQTGNYSYKWFKNNSEILGQTNPIYTVRDSGVYKVEITLIGSTCIATDEVIIEYSSKPSLTSTRLIQCDDDNDGVATFDLTKVNSIITGNNTQLSSVVYFENINDTNPISNPSSYRNTNTNTVYGRVSNSFGCVAFATVNLQISNQVIGPQNPILKCDGDGNLDGFTVFNLNNDATPQILLGLPTGLVVEYYLTNNDALSQQNLLTNNYTNSIVNEQIIYARIVNGPDCFGITPVKLKITAFSPTNFDDETVYICNGNPKRISVSNIFSSFVWSNGDRTNYTNIVTAGNYTVTVTNALGCQATKKFIALNSGTAIITSVDIVDFSGSENSININYTGIGNYEFSIDGVHFQNSPQFHNLVEGNYLIYIRDINGCGFPTPTKVFVLDYPRFFTPNGDSYNDFWTIKNSAKYPNMMIYVYDKYGKLITQVNTKANGWDGTYNGQPLPADDYWFSILINNDRIIKGHFALLR
jgi:gliding motility-associated-like protein